MKGILKLSRSPIFLTATLASVLVPSLVVSALAITHQWERLTTDNLDNIWFVDKNIQKSGDYRTYWMRFRYNIPVGYNNRQIIDTYYTIECKTKIRRQRQLIIYDNRGKVVSVDTNPVYRSEVVSPNTSDMTIANYVCKH